MLERKFSISHSLLFRYIFLMFASNRFKIDFHTIDVLADEAIRSGVKDFSQWPTIPQLYVCGEFVGGMFYVFCFEDLVFFT